MLTPEENAFYESFNQINMKDYTPNPLISAILCVISLLVATAIFVMLFPQLAPFVFETKNTPYSNYTYQPIS